MSSTILKKAERVMTICNSCRYCEGFCAVFPAMELRRTFTDSDLKYLANLCHNCRDCYYACQYEPPHEFDLNVPATLATLRLETYGEFSWPRTNPSLLQKNGRFVSLIAAFSVLIILLLTLLFQGTDLFFNTHTGAGAFYKVIPYAAMVVPFSLLVTGMIFILVKGMLIQWQTMGGDRKELLDWPAHLRAIQDTLKLKYLDGGGYGCNYPNERFSMIRRNFHHGVFYGFMLCLASTSIAFFYDHILGLQAPYLLWSWPVFLGTIGGISLLVGTAGLLYLKFQMDQKPAASQTFTMDVAFITLLFLTSLTGLALLVLRSTPLMGGVLVLHLGCVLGFFLTMPYGKFLHAPYRYLALVKNAREQHQNNH